MDINISENIRTMRKDRKLTQEQLAEALGVSIGAVSKWESALSIPDIGMILELASFFETSVDVLLGYELHKGTIDKTLETLILSRRQKAFDTGIREAEKALKKFPNNFNIVYECAITFSAFSVEQKSEELYMRALELHELCLELLPQNTNPNISEISIKRDMANIYITMGKADAAIDLLKKSNFKGINNIPIGYALATICHKPDEALPYLSNAVMNIVLNQLIQLCSGLSEAYLSLERTDDAIYAMEWYIGILRGLRLSDEISYLDKLEAICLVEIANMYVANKETEKAHSALKRAIMLGRRFETNPCYTIKGMRFYHGNGTETAYDDLGGAELSCLYRRATEDDRTAEQINALWDEIINDCEK